MREFAQNLTIMNGRVVVAESNVALQIERRKIQKAKDFLFGKYILYNLFGIMVNEIATVTVPNISVTT